MAKPDGSFDGHPFWLESSDLEAGRRLFVFEFPGAKWPSTEDLGAATKHFQLEVFTVGANFMAMRDALLKAANSLNAAGINSHHLRHPYYGLVTVAAGKVRVRETNTARRYAHLSIECVQIDPTIKINAPMSVPSVTVNSSADAAEADAVASFSSSFSVSGPIALIALGEQGLTTTLNQVANLSSQLNLANTAAAAIAHMGQQLTTLILTPSTLGLQIMGAVHSITDSQFDPLSALRVQMSILASVAAPVIDPSATSVQAQANANTGAFNNLVRMASFCDCARLISGEVDRSGTSSAGVTFDTQEDAIATRDQLMTLAAALVACVSDDQLMSLEALIDEVYTAFDTLMPSTTITTIVLPQTIPAVVLAQQLYADATMADDICTRNGIADPRFVPGGDTLEVLSNA